VPDVAPRETPATRTEVQATYDRIAAHFAETREHPWPDVREFVEGASQAAVAMDLGCGNGRHAGLLADRAERVLGIDISRAVLETARERARDRGFAVDLLQADAGALPVGDGRVGLAVYVATLHHLPTRVARMRSLDELSRVLAHDGDRSGRALVSAWSVEHDAFDRERGFDATVDWTLPDGERVGRFYHVYDREEFADELARSRLSVHERFLSRGNCYAVVGPPGT